jgi:hypothetical protein
MRPPRAGYCYFLSKLHPADSLSGKKPHNRLKINKTSSNLSIDIGFKTLLFGCFGSPVGHRLRAKSSEVALDMP